LSAPATARGLLSWLSIPIGIVVAVALFYPIETDFSSDLWIAVGVGAKDFSPVHPVPLGTTYR